MVPVVPRTMSVKVVYVDCVGTVASLLLLVLVLVFVLWVWCGIGVCLRSESVIDAVVLVWYCDDFSMRLWRVCVCDECGLRELGLRVSPGSLI